VPDQLPFNFMVPSSDWVAPTELPDLRGTGVIAIDTETKDDGLKYDRGPGWAMGMSRIVGVSMASKRGKVYVSLAHPDSNNFDHTQVGRWLADHMSSGEEIVFQNAPYDLGNITSEWGSVPLPARLHDTNGMAFMLDEQRLTYNLDSLCRWQGVPGKDESLLVEVARAYGYDPKGELWKLPARYVGPYGEQDAQSTLELYWKFMPQLIGQEVLEAYQLEMDLIPMVLAMRRRGIRMNVDRLEQSRDWMYSVRNECLAELSRRLAIGRAVTIEDVNSKKFLSTVFRNEKITPPKTEIGNDSFESDWMAKLDHWLPQLCARAMKYHDAGHKFIDGYLLSSLHRGRIHAEVNQFRSDRGGTKTSRFSYSNPPLQQMPSRDDEIATRIRGGFEPEHGEIWGALDYSQQEYRLIVHFAILCKVAGADKPAAMYRDNPKTDFHDMVAELTGLPRRRAKDVNFAKAFGAGVPKFALMTGMSLEEAEATMKQYDEEAPFVKRLSEFVSNVANNRGYIRMLDGARARFDRWEPRWYDRKKPVPEGKSVNACSREEAMERLRDPDHPWSGQLKRAFTHKSMNWLIQGSAARMTKLSMRACWRAGLTPLLQMHDELDFSFSEKRQSEIAVECMRDTVKLEVPVVVDAEFGVNWGRAKTEKDANKRVVYDASWEAAVGEMR
jgi:DNA polymerase I-like protein with 3'-5' exonuclease and polymerase domains